MRTNHFTGNIFRYASKVSGEFHVRFITSQQKKFMKLFTISIFYLLLLCSCVSTGIKDHAESVNSSAITTSDSSSYLQNTNSKYYIDSLKLIKQQNIDKLNTIDFVKFRYSYILARDESDIVVTEELEEELKQAVKAEDKQKALNLCNEILEKDYTDIYAHVMRNYLYKLDGKDVSFYQAYVGKVMDSLFTSGDGRTPQTAFLLFQVKEEYEVLKFLRLQPRKQSLIEDGGKYFDLLTATDEKGNKHEIYFNITEHMQSIKSMLSNKKN